MHREIIELTEFEIAPILDDCAIESEVYDEFFDKHGDVIGNPIWEQFNFIAEKVTDYDLDKAYECKETIVQRKVDGKFFKGTWVHSPHAWNGNSYDTSLIEVVPTQVTTIVYE